MKEKEHNLRNSIKTLVTYETWYDFRRELQRRSGLILLNQLWFLTKPRDPLPWNEIHMNSALSVLSGRIQRLTICPRCGGNLVLDRDIDGYFKRCIQCSFNVSITLNSKFGKKSPDKSIPLPLNA